MASPDSLYAFRDPNGIRPLVVGQLPEDRGWVVASETCGLDIVGATFIREVAPGEIIRFNKEGMVSEMGVEPENVRAVSLSMYISLVPIR